MSEQEKSRHQSVLEFLEILQLEYLVAELRSKIYPKPKDKKFWKERVMVGKEKKVRDIVSRNPGLPHIFSDKKEMDRLRSVVYPEFGMPNFCYKDEEQERELAVKDFDNYFIPDSAIRVRINQSNAQPATLVKVLEGKELAVVKMRGQENKTTVHISNIARIL